MQIDNLAFWGIFLIITGFALLVRVIFSFNFPLLKVLIGLFFIMLGLKIVFGNYMIWPLKTAANEIFFGSSIIDVSDDLQHVNYNVVFSLATFNMNGMKHPGEKVDLKINNVFSGTTIYLSSEVPVKIEVDAAFAGVKMPGRNTPVFGRGSYVSDDFNFDTPYVDINANAVFGNVTFMYLH